MTSKGLILVVDDDPDIVATSRIILESNGYEVHTASNGKEALDLLSRIKPDLMLLDVMMASDTEGFDLAFKLKEDPEFKDLPIIMLTAFLDKVRDRGSGALRVHPGRAVAGGVALRKTLGHQETVGQDRSHFQGEKNCSQQLTAAGNTFLSNFHPEPLPQRRREGDGCFGA